MTKALLGENSNIVGCPGVTLHHRGQDVSKRLLRMLVVVALSEPLVHQDKPKPKKKKPPQPPRAKENNGAPGSEGSKKKGSAPADAAAASETKGKGAKKKGKTGAK